MVTLAAQRSCLLVVFLLPALALAAEPKRDAKPPSQAQKEDAYYRLVTLPAPPDLVLEVGGLAWLDAAQERLLACTRRGDILIIDNPYSESPDLTGPAAVRYKPFVSGLHEPLGMAVKDGDVYLVQRGELTRVRDQDKDGRADLVENFCNAWQVSGNYHEFAFGPVLDRAGNFWVTLNRPFGGGPEGQALWRGWAVKVDAKGRMTPVCCGIRSPAGLGMNGDGEIFYTDNQGEWTPACKLAHISPKSFHGEATGVASCSDPRSPMKPPLVTKGDIVLADAVKQIPELKLPAVWFPYPRMGRSHGEPHVDSTAGKFGPFAGQMFVGDQGNSIVVRCFLEKVGGEYQGACFPFREGFQCGALRLLFGKDGSLFVGQTNRGWGSSGGKPWGLQRLVWTGKTPFEAHEMRARPDGFEVTFTQPVDPATAADPRSYAMKRWTYYHHPGYGCPPVDTQPITVTSAKVAPDGRSVRLTVNALKATYVHELRLDGVRSADGQPLLHPEAYYTLNRIPEAGPR